MTHPKVEGANGRHHPPTPTPAQHLRNQGTKNTFGFSPARCVESINDKPCRPNTIPSLQYVQQAVFKFQIIGETFKRLYGVLINSKFDYILALGDERPSEGIEYPALAGTGLADNQERILPSGRLDGTLALSDYRGTVAVLDLDPFMTL